jgi:hypothetical protein
MTGAMAPGSMQAQCNPEQMAAGLRRLNRATEGHSGHRLQHKPSRQFPLAAGGVSSSGCRRGGQHRASLQAVTVPDASTDSAAQQPQWERLEALYTSDQFPVSAPSPWRLGLPSPAESSALQQLLRPVGGLLHLAVQLEESPQKLQQDQEERRKRQDYYANVGDAIRTLREETPLLFWRDLTCEQGVSFALAGTCLLRSLHTLHFASPLVTSSLYRHTVRRRHLPGGCGVQGPTQCCARQEKLQAHLQGGCRLSIQVAMLSCILSPCN